MFQQASCTAFALQPHLHVGGEVKSRDIVFLARWQPALVLVPLAALAFPLAWTVGLNYKEWLIATYPPKGTPEDELKKY